MSWKLIVALLCLVLAIIGAAFSANGKGRLKTIGILTALVFSFALPFFLSPYLEDTFAQNNALYAKIVGYTGGFMIFVLVLALLQRDWNPVIGRILLAIFFILGITTIILSIYISKSYFVPETSLGCIFPIATRL